MPGVAAAREATRRAAGRRGCSRCSARSSAGAFAVAIAAPGTPPQFSLPHSPVANASVIVLPPARARSSTSGVRVPDTIVEMTLVFQSMLMLVSL